MTLFAAVAAGVWIGGYLPGLLVAFVGYLACAYLFIEPRGSFGLNDVRNLVGLVAYLITCSIIIGLGQTMRLTQHRLAEQKERLRTTLASIGDAVITTNTEGRITNMNSVAESLTGWQMREASGEQLGTVFHIVNEKTRQPAANPAVRAIHEGVIVGLANHTVLIARSGTELPIDDSAAPIRCAEGEIVGCVLVFRDVTERRRNELAARYLASIIESSDDAIISKDLNGIVTSWNRAAEQLFGYSAAEAVGRPIAMLAPPDRADEMPSILARVRTGERVDHFDTVRRAKDGRLVPISLTVSPIKDEHGEIVGASKIAKDISQRKRAEEALKDADRRKDEFLATLSHELRNPLMPVMNSLELLKRARGEPAVIESARTTMERQMVQMVRLVDDLLDVSRITRGKIDLRKENVELAPIAHQALEACRPLADGSQLQVHVQLPPAPIYLDADPVRLGQVLGNLLNNACKYTDAGGKVSLIAEHLNGTVIIRVKDSGIGIPPEMLPKVFDLFTQVNSSLARSRGGLGIGLTLVKRLVEMHGGTIEAHSPGVGKGSEFVVRLPTGATHAQ